MESQINAEPREKLEETGIQMITPFLWFDNQAEEAVNFYTSIFKNSRIKFVTRYSTEAARASGMKENSVMTAAFRIEGEEFVALNGGPAFKITPAISFFVSCENLSEIEKLWEMLSKGGTVLMALDQYPFGEKYGWIQDRFGVSWQLMLMPRAQKIAPCFLFVGEQYRKAEEAINFYVSVFLNSNIIQLERYKADQGQEGVVHARFSLNGQEFIAMDSGLEHAFTFNPAISMVVNCETQEEVDYYWEKLAEGGYEGAQQCGWLQDRYGISWQIVPATLGELLSDPDPAKSGRVMQAMLRMKKIDIHALKQAYVEK